MAEIRISQITAKSSNLASTDEFAIAESDGSGGFVSKKISGAEITKGITEIDFNTQSATYTLVLDDQNKVVEVNNGSANEIIVPLNSAVAFPIGTKILVAQLGAGQTTIGKSVGVTFFSQGNKLKLVGQYSIATLIKKSTNTWYLFGDITT